MENTKLTEDYIIDINHIDQIVIIGMLIFENKLIKTMYSSQCSLELGRRIQHATYWRLVKSQFKTKISQHKRLLEIKTKLSLEYDATINTLAHFRTQVAVASKKSREIIYIVLTIQDKTYKKSLSPLK